MLSKQSTNVQVLKCVFKYLWTALGPQKFLTFFQCSVIYERPSKLLRLALQFVSGLSFNFRVIKNFLMNFETCASCAALWRETLNFSVEKMLIKMSFSSMTIERLGSISILKCLWDLNHFYFKMECFYRVLIFRLILTEKCSNF